MISVIRYATEAWDFDVGSRLKHIGGDAARNRSGDTGMFLQFR